MSRDYVAEMRAVIDSETAEGPYSSPVIAARIVDKLRIADPDLLRGWLDEQAVSLLRQTINQRDRSARTSARYSIPRSVFAAAAADHEAGDETAMNGWLNVVHVVADGRRKRLAEMTVEDLLVVADDYGRRAKHNLMHEAFLRALAKQVGDGVVADRYTDAKLTALWASING